MQDFEYVAPTTLDEAVRLMAESGPNAKALAGGTDVIVQLRGGRFQIDRLVDVKKVPEMNELSYSEANGLTVGAAVPCCLVYEKRDRNRALPRSRGCGFPYRRNPDPGAGPPLEETSVTPLPAATQSRRLWLWAGLPMWPDPTVAGPSPLRSSALPLVETNFKTASCW